jgi:hypothetical protein
VSAGAYTAQLRIVGAEGTGSVVSQTTVRVRRDPMVRLTDAEWAELNDARRRAFNVIREANELVLRLEEAKRSAPQAAAAALDSAIVRLRGAQPQGGQRFGGRGGGRGGGPGGPPNVMARAQAVANQIGTNHFRPTAQHRQDLAAVEQDLARERTAAETAIQRARGGLN